MQLLRSGLVQQAACGLIDVSNWRHGMHLAGPKRFGFVDVADAGREPLVEQYIGDLTLLIGGGDVGDDRVELDIIEAQIGSDPIPWPFDSFCGVKQLHRWRCETHRFVIGGCDNGSHRSWVLPPALTAPVQLPIAGHLQMRVQDHAIGECDQQMLPASLNGLN